MKHSYISSQSDNQDNQHSIAIKADINTGIYPPSHNENQSIEGRIPIS